MKVLHITSWYPNKDSFKEGVFIKEHINALNQYCENDIWRVRCYEDKPFRYEGMKRGHFLVNILYVPFK